MEAFDDLMATQERIVEPDWQDFGDHVRAEGDRKARVLSSIQSAMRERLDSSVGLSELMVDDDGGSNADSPDDMRCHLFEGIPDPYPHSTKFQRVIISESGEEVDGDTIKACKVLDTCMGLRDKWLSDCTPAAEPQRRSESFRSPVLQEGVKGFRRRPGSVYNVFDQKVPESSDEYSYAMSRGVFEVRRLRGDGEKARDDDDCIARPFEEFITDFITVRSAIHAGNVRSFTFKQLELLSAKFNLHELLNAERENDATKSVPHRDFYNVRKVDTHVHHSACMNQKHLLRFIKNKLKNNYDEVVVFRDGKFLTLGEVFKSLNLTAYDLSIDTLDMHANNTFHRFDRFNLKYNPAGQSRLREIFLKTDNVIGGRYLAEITKEVMDDLEQSKYQLVEWRISIYGRKLSEWSSLAQWFYVNRLAHANVRWLIQVPRIYHIYRKGGELKNFGEMLHNIFQPLFEVTLDPKSNIPLHYFLETIVGFDSVDDESRPEFGVLSSSSSIPVPDEWTAAENPPYGYWMYYMYANICTLNQLRAKRGLSTFQYRPHCGEAGDVDHLISTYLLAQQVNHGILLRKAPALHYLYYLSQVGIAMSPLSNNKLFLDYNKNPFPKYFKQGLNVSLSTDDPLMLHYTKDALVEEYSVATQVWKLSSTDQCEIARNSVIQSGWEDVYKRHFLGEGYSDMRETNVPIIRLRFRQETLNEEISYIKKTAGAAM